MLQQVPPSADSLVVDEDSERRAAAQGHAGVLSAAALSYVVGPLALAFLLGFRYFGLVANVPAWTYAVAIGGSMGSSRVVERWPACPRGSWRLHVRVVVHVAGVVAVIYLCGWGPALGMAFAFSALADLQMSGASAWRAALGWSIVGCIVGQALILVGWAPSFLTQTQAQTIGVLGAFVFGIAIRMAGAVGEAKEQADARLLAGMHEANLARDETDLARAEALLLHANYQAIVQSAAIGIMTYDRQGFIVSFNSAAETIFEWPASDVIGASLTKIMPEDLHASFREFLANLSQIQKIAKYIEPIELVGCRRDGTPFPMLVSTSPVIVDGSVSSLAIVVRDLSEQKRAEAQLVHHGLHDALTGLANRVMFTDRLEQAVARRNRNGSTFAVLFIDLDRFKTVNDTLGHTAGDQLLMQAAARMQLELRELDTVARLGGDEFVVLCEDIEGVHHATDIAQRIADALRDPFALGNDTVQVGASIGVVLSNDDLTTADSILSNADIAMYRAKDNGRNRIELFDTTMQEWVTNQNALEADLRLALPGDELRVFYQPTVTAESGEICGFEALLRWERPGFGLVAPDDFIPIAEESGLIVGIGQWVLEQACRNAANWALRWPHKRIGVAVNVSSRQLKEGNFREVVANVLAYTRLDPDLLTLELTESTIIEDTIDTAALLAELRDLGVHIALDDVGTGYASLTYLRSFPFDVLKIDRSFVQSIGTDRDDTAIVAAVLALARNLNLTVVAEGVEDHQQLAVLLQLQCARLQGYLFSRPRPLNEVEGLIDGPILGLVTSDEI